MMNIVKQTSFLMILAVLFVSASSFSSSKNNNFVANSDNYCTLTITTSGGSPVKSAKVTTDVSGGISCAGGREFRTASDGEVTLYWVSGCSLKKIYVNGKGYNVDYKNGGSYRLTI